ncbi:MAG: DUF1145 domain-containing protein [Idiomarina sp.]|uniref:Uncharacterized protein YhhL (DUF1145 family) n=1 Tax=Idiomarina aquatica TaxID=1327752 RepID=A0A4R6P4F1_9GAMM|nr:MULTISPECIES: DUF1145 domain-containing protein [Idiomarina]MAK72461.1 DUF1145 domain-containing protein [Idiomarinaceae bacterium]MBT41523.1 DUF1145 domain-containing protein [Idiomarina sp.]TDP30789.1 uncharacterized protein YhhL (DUF1145 family) [Idiomarina aquatica]
MKIAIIMGKCVFAVIWLALFSVLAGFAGEVGQQTFALVALLLAVMIIMHLLLLGTFVAIMKPQMLWKKGDSWQILAFGIFAWLAIFKRTNEHANNADQSSSN